MFREFLWTWIPWIFNKYTLVYSKCQFTYNVIYNGIMVKKQWVFIKNCEIPLQSDAFRTINDDTRQWRCTLCPATFSQPGITANKKHVSYLGFTIKVQGAEIDISDWVNEVLWCGSREPTLREIFLLWSCESGQSYFHCLDHVEIELITDMGDTLRLRL